jgi:GTPase SAR1 family protein
MGNAESNIIENNNNQNDQNNIDTRNNSYNMKVIICGAKSSGKTNLWRRLKGIKFNSNHSPTNDIQVTKIDWDMKDEDDIVIVDIWDISNDTNLNNNDNNYIYTGTNAVLFTINPFDYNSLEYVMNNYMNIPIHINILLLLIAKDLTSNNSNEIKSSSIKKESHLNKNNQVVTLEMVEDLYIDIKKYRKKLYKNSTTELLVNNCNKNDFLDVSIHMFEISSKDCFGYEYLYEV